MNNLKEVRESSAQLNRAYFNLFGTPDGKLVMDDLLRNFHGTLLKKADGIVDANACMAAIGEHRVIKHIEDRKHDGELAR